MTVEQAPFDLGHGVALESPPVVIPWGTGVTDLAKVGHPEVKNLSNVTFVSWKDNTILGGIEADVVFRSDVANVFWFEIRGKERFASAREAYGFVLSQLVVRIGEPHSSVVDQGFPWVTWKYGPVRLGLRVAERFREYVSFMVSRGL